MWKKFCSSLLALIILTAFSISAYAGQTDGVGSTTSPAINTGAQQNVTGGALTGTGGAIKSTATSKGAISDENSATSESAISSKSTAPEKKPSFTEVFTNVLKDSTAVNNDYFVMKITSPDKDKDITYKKSYIISGNSKYDDVVISIAKFNEDKGEYEPMKNTDGETSWAIGEYRAFSKEIILTEGTNKIKIITYRTSEMEEANADKIQRNCYSISFLKPSVLTKAVNRAADAIMELDIFKNNNKGK
jgi:hypothetical protein